MPKIRSWTNEQLEEAVKASYSFRHVLILLGLVPAGGNYQHVKYYTIMLNNDTSHFTGKGWNVGGKFRPNPARPLEEILVLGNRHNSHSLKKRLFLAGILKQECELCKWNEMSLDGRIPVELDHINGNHFDNRLENLRILCPNCHSLQPTHRGRNKGTYN